MLIDLLKSSAAAEGAGVLRAACVAVGAVGRDAAAAAALLELGALRALEAAAADEEHPARCAATATIEVLARAHPSFQYWFRSYVGAREPLPDGFLDVGAGRPFATAKQLAGSPPTDAHEVLLVDASTDAPLAALIERARLDAAKAEPAAAAATALANIVSDALGGAVDYEEYAHYDCGRAVADAKARAASDVVPLGALARGGARHRALLYKVLADRCGWRASCARAAARARARAPRVGRAAARRRRRRRRRRRPPPRRWRAAARGERRGEAVPARRRVRLLRAEPRAGDGLHAARPLEFA